MKAEGKGKGTMTVVTVYNAKVPEKDNKCDNFDLRVQVEDVRMGESPTCPHHVVTTSPCILPHVLYVSPPWHPKSPLISSVSPHCPHVPHRQARGRHLPLHQDHDLHQVGQAGDVGDIRDIGDREWNGDTGGRDIREKEWECWGQTGISPTLSHRDPWEQGHQGWGCWGQ